MKFNLVILNLLLYLPLWAQEDCYLSIDGIDDDVLAEVFQMTESQWDDLRNWGVEVQFRNEPYAHRANRLLQTHPQNTKEDLQALAKEYKILLDKMLENVRLIDKRMLASFNDEQYEVYIVLCSEAGRNPFLIKKSDQNIRK